MLPFAIVRLWEMLQINPGNLFASAANVALIGEKIRQNIEYQSSEETYILFGDKEPILLLMASIRLIAEQAEQIGLPVTLAASVRCKTILERFVVVDGGFQIEAKLINRLVDYGSQLNQSFSDEIFSKMVLVVDSKHAKFYDDSECLFGEDVENAFPSSVPEIAEAGKCRALGRWTASVMHLMRALEPPLLTLQAAVGVNVPKEQWGQIIDQIEAKIREIKKSSHGKADEQWFSEAASHFRIIKNAWRNHAQHLHERYDEERAVAIYDSVRAFTRQLATRLSE